MKTKQTLLAAVILGATLLTTTGAQAALVSRLGGLAVYDTDLNITWLADANAANGLMNWTAANVWASYLTVGGFSGWRLPTTLQPDASCGFQSGGTSFGYNCTGSEMGHLFYSELGGVAGQPIATTHNANYDLFQNVQSDFYWSRTAENAPQPSFAWYFHTGTGGQFTEQVIGNMYAWAVHDGDVGASTVPVPAAAWLFGSGLPGLIGIAKRKKA